MARFLSAEWFEQLVGGSGEGAAGPGAHDYGPGGGESGTGAPLVVEIYVTACPQGELRYQVVVEGARACVLPPGAAFKPAQVELSSDYATMVGIASGRLSAVDALSLGRARVSGDTAALSSGRLAGLDLVPPALRAATTF